MCVCVCVCGNMKRDREREGEREGERNLPVFGGEIMKLDNEEEFKVKSEVP